MAATDVMPSSPLTPGQVAPWSSFEEYLDFPSPLPTPRLAPLSTPSTLQGQQQTPQTGGSTIQAPLQGSHTATSSATSSPPPPGSSPEVLFRYYLAAELRRIGSSADEAIIDRYVAQHYDSFTKAMDRQQGGQSKAPQSSTPQGSNRAWTPPRDTFHGHGGEGEETTMAAFRSSPPTGPSSAPYMLSSEGHAGQSISPHLMELSSVHQPFTVSRLPTTEEKSSVKGSPSSSKGKFRDHAGEDEEMSEDEDEDEKDTLADLVNDFKTSNVHSAASSRGGQEETPIAGSIMGPANELRPDPEAYRKLSSKEKRQLRNKISARNFRTRRKEHISHLEQQVADRDTVIEGLRQQLAQVNFQNKELNEEVKTLKTKSISNADVSRIIEALQKGAATGSSGNETGAPSHLLRTSSNSSLSDSAGHSGRPSTPSMLPSSPRSNSPRPLLARPNMRKDLPSTSNANSSKSFWGGVGGTGNNFMSVHTVLVPHLPKPADEHHRFDSKLSGVNDEAADLSRMLEAKLDLAGMDEGKDQKKDGKGEAMREADVNEAIASLLGDLVAPPPPSYSEAIGDKPSPSSSTPSLDLGDERIQATVVCALQDALSTPMAPSFSSKSAHGQHNNLARLDPTKIRALLEGRAKLVLYDEEKGQVWKESTAIQAPSSSPMVLNPSIQA